MKKYHIAIGPDPNIMRRTSREVSGDVVLGFALTIVPVDDTSNRITCDMLNAGYCFSDAALKACLNTMSKSFGKVNIQRAVASWLQEMHHVEVQSWLQKR